jgi:hypothetical protein
MADEEISNICTQESYLKQAFQANIMWKMALGWFQPSILK